MSDRPYPITLTFYELDVLCEFLYEFDPYLDELDEEDITLIGLRDKLVQLRKTARDLEPIGG